MNANTMFALLKREVWEHRTFWIVPSVIAGLIITLFAWAMIVVMPREVGYARWVEKMMRANNTELGDLGSIFIPGLAAPFFVMMVFVIGFYLLDALYSERRDRSILFWKSLPVTDTVTVLSKWATALVVFPFIVFAIIVALSIVMSLLAGIFVLFGGGNPWTLVWQHFGLFSGIGQVLLGFYVQALWYLPVMGWLLLASAWAKKAPFLWATLLPVGVMILEEMFLDTNRFFYLVTGRLVPFSGSEGLAGLGRRFEGFGGNVQIDATFFNVSVLGELFTTPAFWTGLVFAAVCTGAAIWLRRYRDES